LNGIFTVPIDDHSEIFIKKGSTKCRENLYGMPCVRVVPKGVERRRIPECKVLILFAGEIYQSAFS
jgi:hypothetical protein